MTTGTKIFLAVFSLFIGILVLYYGVLMPGPNASSLVASVEEKASGSPDHRSLNELASEISPAPSDAAGTLQTGGAQPVVADPATPGAGIQPVQPVAGARETDQAVQSPVSPAASNVPDIANLPNPFMPLTRIDQPAQAGGSSGHNQGALPDQPLASKPQANPQAPVEVNPHKLAISAPPTPPQTSEYTIRAGDTMSSIAEQWFGDETMWALIAKDNPWVDPSRMQIGQKLRLPHKDAVLEPAPQPKPKAAPPAAVDKASYTVRSGDTLARIARDLYGDVAKWRAIFEANRKAIGSDPGDLKPGMKLTLPPGAKVKSN